MNAQIISIVNKKPTHVLFPLFHNTADYLLIFATQKIYEASTISYKRLRKTFYSPFHMSAVVETSFLRHKNVGFFNYKQGRAADANRTIN